jgi:putative ABC transport system substrate-binding protein
MEVTVKNHRFTVSINNKQTTDFINPRNNVVTDAPGLPLRLRGSKFREDPLSGYIGVQAHTGDDSDRFRRRRRPGQARLVASLARPGGNATGINFFTAEVVAKRLGLLRDLLPAAARVAVLVNPTNVTNTPSTLRDVEAATRALGLEMEVLNASTSREIEAAFAALGRGRPDALFVAPDALFTDRRVQLANLAARHALAASFSARENVEAGGLMSYGANLADLYRRVGVYSGRILKGTKPADLPVEQSTKFELVINHPTARMLGLIIPPTLLAIDAQWPSSDEPRVSR